MQSRTILFLDGYTASFEPCVRERATQFIFLHTVLNPSSREQFEIEARDLFASWCVCSSPVLLWRTEFEVNFGRDFETNSTFGNAHARGFFGHYWPRNAGKNPGRVYGKFAVGDATDWAQRYGVSA